MKIFLIAAVILVLVLPVTVLAQETANPCSIENIRDKTSAEKDSSLPACINQIYKWSLGVGALLALLMTVVGGYMYMTSAGNAEQAAKGTEYIWGAIIGLALLFGAYLILNTINPDLVNFQFSTDELNQTQPPTESESGAQ